MKGFKITKNQSMMPLLQWVVVPFCLIFVLIPYLQVEFVTNFHPAEKELFVLNCLDQRVAELRYVKIISLNKQMGSASIFCGFKPREQNVLLYLEKQQEKWVVTYKEPANSAKTWPIYL